MPSAPPPPTLTDGRPRVVFDRGPKQPGEDWLQYENRTNFATGFDRFLASTNLSPDKEHRLLLALYDYQEANLAVYEDMSKATRERILRREPYPEDVVYEMILDTERQLAAKVEMILGPGELRLWFLKCAGCYMYAATERRILRLSDE